MPFRFRGNWLDDILLIADCGYEMSHALPVFSKFGHSVSEVFVCRGKEGMVVDGGESD